MPAPHFNRVLFLICPTGSYCREDRCQSFFDPKLIPSMRPPLEECEAAGALRSLNVKSLVIDAPAMRVSDSEVRRRIEEYQPDLIVLSVTFGSLEADAVWAKQIRDLYPNVPIGLRGAPCYVSGEQLLEKYSCIDFCLRGDYELVWISLIEKGIWNADGIICRSPDGTIIVNPQPLAQDLDVLPLPNRSCIDPNLYRVRFFGPTQATVRVQRGCPFPCSYCLVHTVSGNRARHRSPASIVRELQALMAQGIRFFYFRAETFSLDRRWTLALCEAIATHCPGIHWISATRVECVDSELLEAFKKSGCYGLSFGVDVASKEIAKRVRKPLQPELAEQGMRLCDQHKILSLAYIMIGFLWETPETLQEAADFVRTIRPDLLTINFAHPYPGTDYYNQVKQAEIEIASFRAQAEPALNMPGLSSSFVAQQGRSILKRHYARPAVIYSIAKKLCPLGVAALSARFFASASTQPSEPTSSVPVEQQLSSH